MHTDQGLTGLGETSRGSLAVEAQIHDLVAPYLVGKDPLAIQAHNRQLLASFLGFGSSSAEIRAASVIDIALWDIFGQAMGQPIYQLLGKFTVGGVIWHRTGDAGYLDGYGCLWLLGRCMARIVDGRGVLYPLSVESAACANRAVRRAACVSSEGRRILFVEREPRATCHHLNGLHARLSWALLDEIQILRRIPVDRRHNAKIDHPALRSMVSSRIPATGSRKPIPASRAS